MPSRRDLEENTGFKKCSKCKKVKPVEDFYPNYNYKSKQRAKYRPNCKVCQRSYTQSWIIRHPEQAKAINYRAVKKYSAKPENQEKMRAWAKSYYETHKERYQRYHLERKARLALNLKKHV